ncbi:MAG TPA: SPOR domain-containing protein [Methylocella sp.]|nr:SPOR domain-containing protein [Methylocella sp.]
MSEPIVKRRPMIDLEEFERRLRKPAAQGAEGSDPLAELARFAGELDDPFRPVFEPLSRRPEETLRSAAAAGPAKPVQEPLIRGDFAEIEAGLLGAARKYETPEAGGMDEFGHDAQIGEEGHWRYDESLGVSAQDADAPFEEIRSRRPLYVMAAMIVAGIAGIGASFAFKGAATSQGEIATIKAAEGPAKVQPEIMASAETPAQEASVLAGSPPQQPVAAATAIEEPADLAAQASAEAVQAIPVATSAESAGAASVPVPPPPAQAEAEAPQRAAEPVTIASLIEPKKVKTVSVRPDGTLLPNDTPPPAAAAHIPPVPAARPQVPASAKAVTPKSPARMATTPKPPAADSSGNAQAAQTSVAAKTRHAEAEGASGQSAAQGAAPGTFSVQLAAPGTEQEARDVQMRLMKRFGAELAGFHPSIHKAAVGGKAVYRVRVSGLPTREEASALCQKLQSSGGNCFVAKN